MAGLLGGLTAAATPAAAAAHPTVTGMSPHRGHVSAAIIVTGTGFTDVKSVQFGGTRVTRVAVISTHELVVRAPRHALGTVAVRVTTGHGTSAAVRPAHFTYISPPRPDVKGHRLDLHQVERPSDLACPTTTFCAAFTDDGYVTMTHNGTTWSDPLEIFHRKGAATVSCLSATDCVATAYDQWSRYDGTSWSTPAALPLGATDSSCPTARYCLAIAHSRAAVFDGTSWHRITPPTWTTKPYFAYQNPVSCSSSTFCLALNASNEPSEYAIYDGTSWTTKSLSAIPDAVAVDCPAASTCILADSEGKVATYHDGTWSDAVQLPGAGGDRVHLSCVSATWCLLNFAGDDLDPRDGQTFVYDGGAWTQHGGQLGALALDCTAVDQCRAVSDWSDDGIKVVDSTFSGTDWSPSQFMYVRVLGLDSVSCAPESTQLFCGIGDEYGHAMTLANRTFGRGVTVADRVADVSCPTGTFCAAVGTDGTAAVYNGKAWGQARTIDPLADGKTISLVAISCASASFCAAVDSQGFALVYNGKSWSAPKRVYTHGALTDVSCAAVNYCFAVGGNASGGVAVRYGGGHWGPFRTIDRTGAITALSCPTTHFCAAGTTVGVREWGGTVWSQNELVDTGAPSVSPGTLSDISCSSAQFCLLVGGVPSQVYDKGFAWASVVDGTTSTAVPKALMSVWKMDDNPPHASCSANYRCTLVDALGGYRWSI